MTVKDFLSYLLGALLSPNIVAILLLNTKKSPKFHCFESVQNRENTSAAFTYNGFCDQKRNFSHVQGRQCRRYRGPGGGVPPISVYSEYVFGTSLNDKTTGNNGKKNNNVQT